VQEHKIVVAWQSSEVGHCVGWFEGEKAGGVLAESTTMFIPYILQPDLPHVDCAPVNIKGGRSFECMRGKAYSRFS